MTPFRNNSTALTLAERAKFNKYFSSFRVRVEHSFGVLKERFCSLYGLPIRVHDKQSHKYACDWIYVCCVLHNIMIPYYDEDDWVDVNEHFRRVQSQDEEVNEELEDVYDDLAEAKRIALAEIVLDKIGKQA